MEEEERKDIEEEEEAENAPVLLDILTCEGSPTVQRPEGQAMVPASRG